MFRNRFKIHAITVVNIFSRLMPFCAEGAKRHYKWLTIDGIFWVVYSRLELHVDAEMALHFENVVRVRTHVHACIKMLLYKLRSCQWRSGSVL